MDQVAELYFATHAEWRKWLSINHNLLLPVWLVFYKKETGVPTLSYDDAVEQALCYGWIDGTIKNIDSKKYKRKFYPRKNFYNWSPSNRKRVEKLINNKEMTEFGLAKIGEYASTHQLIWPQLNDNSRPQLPDKLIQLLKTDELAYSNFMNLAPSHQKRYILWVMQAKREETRIKRMNAAIKLLRLNTKNPLM